MKQIRSVLISVYHKDGLNDIISELKKNDHIKVYSTGGTYDFLNDQQLDVQKVEDITGYPSILGGRVKTLHPKIFGGILAKRENEHILQLDNYKIPEIDCVVVDLYPFEETLKHTSDADELIEKIDIGGVSLIRAAAKNYKNILVIPSMDAYPTLFNILSEKEGFTSMEERRVMAKKAFAITSHYDVCIHSYFAQDNANSDELRLSENQSTELRYGENPHQIGRFYGNIADRFEQLNGKKLSYNNLVDVDAAMEMMFDFKDMISTFIVIKHTISCGVAVRSSNLEAFHAALACDPTSAFGGILITNTEVGKALAEQVNKLFYEVLIAPSFTSEALTVLCKKKKRILLKAKDYTPKVIKYKSILGGVVAQSRDSKVDKKSAFQVVTDRIPSESEKDELEFALKCVKHIKSNTIAISKDHQLIGMGSGQTSRVDACIQAIEKAKKMGFELKDSVLASDAFFPFPDCVELGYKAGIRVIAQPGGSINDKLSIEFCNNSNMSMVFTGSRHFKH